MKEKSQTPRFSFGTASTSFEDAIGTLSHTSGTAWGEVDRAITAQAPAVPLVWDKVPMASSKDVDAVPNENLGVWDFSFTSLR